MTEWSQLDGGLKVPEALKRSGQFVITKSKIVELLEVTRVGSVINCAKLLLSKNEYNFPPTSLFPDGFATS